MLILFEVFCCSVMVAVVQSLGHRTPSVSYNQISYVLSLQLVLCRVAAVYFTFGSLRSIQGMYSENSKTVLCLDSFAIFFI